MISRRMRKFLTAEAELSVIGRQVVLSPQLAATLHAVDATHVVSSPSSHSGFGVPPGWPTHGAFAAPV
jgi:hypothetical protein